MTTSAWSVADLSPRGVVVSVVVVVLVVVVVVVDVVRGDVEVATVT